MTISIGGSVLGTIDVNNLDLQVNNIVKFRLDVANGRFLFGDNLTVLPYSGFVNFQVRRNGDNFGYFKSDAADKEAGFQCTNNLDEGPVIISSGSAYPGNYFGIIPLAGNSRLVAGGGTSVLIGATGAIPLFFGLNSVVTGKWLSTGEFIIGSEYTSLGTNYLVQAKKSTGSCFVGAKSGGTTSTSGFDAFNDADKEMILSMEGSATAGTIFGVPLAGLASLRTTSVQGLLIGTLTVTPIVFGTNSIERWRMDGSGLLGAGQYVEMDEIGDPAAPAVNKGRLYVKDNGAGKSQLVIRFNTGAVQVIATEP